MTWAKPLLSAPSLARRTGTGCRQVQRGYIALQTRLAAAAERSICGPSAAGRSGPGTDASPRRGSAGPSGLPPGPRARPRLGLLPARGSARSSGLPGPGCEAQGALNRQKGSRHGQTPRSEGTERGRVRAACTEPAEPSKGCGSQR